MKMLFLVPGCWLLVTGSSAQSVSQKLQRAYQQFEADSQLRHAISSLYVINAKTGEVAFDKNSQIGLAPASTQKIITAAAAFELLGKDFRYKTEFGQCIDLQKDQFIWINPSGDPTFGSWRWESTGEKNVLQAILNGFKGVNLKNSRGILINALGWNTESIPDGWIWQDIGNYYGAGADILNWRENQYDLILESGDRIGDGVNVIGTVPRLHSFAIYSTATSAAKGTGDNSYVYLPVKESNAMIRGTIPIGEHQFKISGSIVDPAHEFMLTLEDSLMNRYGWKSTYDYGLSYGSLLRSPQVYFTYYSPPLDSIIYWFLQKSINLYGEALMKTVAAEKKKIARWDTTTIAGSTDSGSSSCDLETKSIDVDERISWMVPACPLRIELRPMPRLKY
jgi:D-alanyl-D-alanine carboxypeptidase/D-alanyl-D-alanine-endopeptidase (penicillin-binding protein 4)